MKVLRSCGPTNVVKEEDELTQEEALKASWDYWERQGLPHPEKQNANAIPSLKRKGR